LWEASEDADYGFHQSTRLINKIAKTLLTSTLLASIYLVQTAFFLLAAPGPYGVEIGKKEQKSGLATFGASTFGKLLKASLPPSATPFFCAPLGPEDGTLLHV
jgi:hypothetical protein